MHFEKITIETFKEDKTINDLISYNIFTTIEIGDRPQQLVGFFLEQNEISFYSKFTNLPTCLHRYGLSSSGSRV